MKTHRFIIHVFLFYERNTVFLQKQSTKGEKHRSTNIYWLKQAKANHGRILMTQDVAKENSLPEKNLPSGGFVIGNFCHVCS